METTFWTKAKSVTLSLVCTRILIGVIIVVAIILPYITAGEWYGTYEKAGILEMDMSSEQRAALLICAYISFVWAMIALIMLGRLLGNIRKEQIFIPANVKCLRIISWCCFAIAIVMLCGWPYISTVLVFIAAAAAFFGLLMRVVKNVIDAACAIKNENDFTI